MQKNTLTDQQERIENPEIDTHEYTQLIFDSGKKQFCGNSVQERTFTGKRKMNCKHKYKM